MMFNLTSSSYLAKSSVMKKKEEKISFVDTRFGKIKINLDKKVYFPNGLLGMPDKTHFCLANFPDANFYRFKILQSTEDDNLSFIILPLDEELVKPNSSFTFIEKQDIELCSNILGIKIEEMAILLITSIHHTGVGDKRVTKLSVNIRAPLIIDTVRNTGLQFVFPNDKYLIQHFI